MTTRTHRIMVGAPNADWSKAEEVAELRNLVQLMQQHARSSYLAMLLNDELANWFEDKVKNDWNCDLAAEHRGSTVELFNTRYQLQQALARESEREAILSDCQFERKNAITMRDAYKHQVNDLSDDLRRARYDNDDKDREIAKLEDRIAELESQSYAH